MWRDVTKIIIQEDTEQDTVRRILFDGVNIGTVTINDPLGGTYDAYAWKRSMDDTHGVARNYLVAISRLLIAYAGYPDLAEPSPDGGRYVWPHNAGDESSTEVVIEYMIRFLNVCDTLNTNVLRGTYGSLPSDVLRMKLKLIDMLEREGWIVSHPRSSYRIQLPVEPRRKPLLPPKKESE